MLDHTGVVVSNFDISSKWYQSALKSIAYIKLMEFSKAITQTTNVAGFVWYHDYPIFASDCNVIYSKAELLITNKFIYEVLRLKQNEIYKL